MQVKDIIAEIRETCRGGSYTDEQLIRWTRELEERIFSETLTGYEAVPEYTAVEDRDSYLFLPEEYADVYRYWLLCRIYLNTGDYDRYNNYAELYATALDAFRAGYIRTHMPNRTNIVY